jgi:hypothetical protein
MMPKHDTILPLSIMKQLVKITDHSLEDLIQEDETFLTFLKKSPIEIIFEFVTFSTVIILVHIAQ